MLTPVCLVVVSRVAVARVEQLSLLQDAVPFSPVSEVRATVEAELQQPLEAVFALFDAQPLAAASIAQAPHAPLPSPSPSLPPV